MNSRSRTRGSEGAGTEPRNATAGELQAQVDALLLEQGALAPLELLFATGNGDSGGISGFEQRIDCVGVEPTLKSL